ncbi:STAS domain-containing protein [Thalassorhabdus alkalitolerans]|uniref:STAS domain-containing protein n=1 Tax=Thalassorhabdus alkalitolerans TaxID=2282697 RepID=A0ABW0YKW4_9BACI
MKNQEALYSFLLENSRTLTEEWYESLTETDPSSVYASTNPEVIRTLKNQNHEFHLHFIEIFAEEEKAWFEKSLPWINEIARDSEHLRTPHHHVIREFMRVRAQYLNYIQQFVDRAERPVSLEEISSWNEKVIFGIDKTILTFVEEAQKNAKKLLSEKQDMINELSVPIIKLNHNTALLPIIGAIDSDRAAIILEHTLHQCSVESITHLFIDLSGVAEIDTMVAHQISHLLKALSLLGIESTLSGIRPEIAQTAVQLNISFDKVEIKSSLSHALSLKK